MTSTFIYGVLSSVSPFVDNTITESIVTSTPIITVFYHLSSPSFLDSTITESIVTSTPTITVFYHSLSPSFLDNTITESLC